MEGLKLDEHKKENLFWKGQPVTEMSREELMDALNEMFLLYKEELDNRSEIYSRSRQRILKLK